MGAPGRARPLDRGGAPLRRFSPAALAALLAAIPLGAPAQTSPPTPPPLPSPIASPVPSESPAAPSPPTPSPPPGPPSAAPSGNAIRVDRPRLALVPGTSAIVNVDGAGGPLVVQPSFTGVSATYDPQRRQLTVTATANGRGTLALSGPGGETATIDVLVAPPAGVVPSDAALELAGNVSPEFLLAKIRAAVTAAAQQQPGTTLDVAARGGVALAPGAIADVPATVRIAGNGDFVDAAGTTTVHVRVDALPRLDPVTLFYDDDPEYLRAADDGVTFRGSFDPGHPARAYIYHVSTVPVRSLSLVLRAAQPTRVQILGYAAGPADAFSYVGHRATMQYLLERASQESAIVTLAPGTPYVLPLGYRPLRSGELVAAVYDFRALDGGSVEASVVGAAPGIDPLGLVGQPLLPDDGHGRRGTFDLTAVAPLVLAYAGGAEPDAVSVGTPGLPNPAPGGRPLLGDYGVLRPVSLELANPAGAPRSLFLYEVPAGGGATTTIWFDGEPGPTEVQCVADPNRRWLVHEFALAPGERRTVTGSYMTDGTSWFPLEFGLTATPPSPVPPHACDGKPAPAASATPVPFAVPSPPAKGART